MCKTSSFPHDFPQGVENTDKRQGEIGKACGLTLETHIFSHRDTGTTKYAVIHSLDSVSFDFLDHFLHFGAERGILGHAFFNGIQGGNYSRMISSQNFTNVGQGHIRHLTDDVNSDVTGIGDILGALGADDIFLLDVILAVDGGKNLIHRNRYGLSTPQQLGNTTSGQLHGNTAACEKAFCAQLLDGTLDLTDVGAKVFSQKSQDVVGNGDVDLIGLFLDDGGTELQIRGLDIRDKPPLKAGLETVLQSLDLTGGTVGGHDDLLAGLVEGVEGMEEFLLRGGLTGDELNIVNEEHVAGAVLISEFVHSLAGEGVDHLVGEVLALDVNDTNVSNLFLQLVCNGVKQVGLTQTAGAVDEERIVSLRGTVRHGQTGSVGKLIGGSYDKIFECIFKIKGRQSRADTAGTEGGVLTGRGYGILCGALYDFMGGIILRSLHDAGLIGRDDPAFGAGKREVHVEAQHFGKAFFNIGLVFGGHNADLDFGFGIHDHGRSLKIPDLQTAQPEIRNHVAQLGAEGLPHKMPDL